MGETTIRFGVVAGLEVSTMFVAQFVSYLSYLTMQAGWIGRRQLIPTILGAEISLCNL